MSFSLPDLIGKVKIDTSQGKAALKELKTEAGAGGKAINDMGALAKTAGISLGALAVAGASAASAIGAAVAAFAKASANLVDLKGQLGIGVVELQKIQYAAKQSNVTFEALTTGLSLMERAAAKTPEKFEQLGISFGKLRTSKPDELLGLIGERLSGVSDANERARIAMDIFGESGSKMLRMLTADFAGLKKEAESTGLLSEEMAAKGKALDGSFTRLSDSMEKLKVNLGAAFGSPAVLFAMQKMADIIGLMSRNAEKLALGLTDSMPGIGLVVRAFNAFGGGGAGGGGGASASGGGGMPGYSKEEATANAKKLFSPLNDAFDKLLDRMDRDAETAAERAERTAEKAGQAAERAYKAWADLSSSLASDSWRAGSSFIADQWAKNSAGLQGLDTHILSGYMSPGMKDPFTGKPKGYSFDNSLNYAGADPIKKQTADLSKNLQDLSHIFALSSTKIGQTLSQFAGNAAGLAGSLSALKGGFGSGLTGILGKVGAIGGIAAAGIGIFSSIFGGGARKKAEQKAAAEAAAKKAEEEAAAAHEKKMAGIDTGAGGLNQFLKGGAITDQGSSDRAGAYATAIFGNMVKETGDVLGALKAIGPSLDEIAGKAQEMGLSLGDGVANLIGMKNVLAGNEGLADQVSGLNQLMTGLSDASLMNKDLFNALGTDASAVFERLMAGGATSNQAMALMQPTLQQLYEGQKLHGWAVDEATQKILDQAEAEGVVGDAFMSANERIVELLGILIETIGGQLPEAYRRAGNAADEYGRRAGEAAAKGMPHIPGEPDLQPNEGSDGGPGFASGTGFRNFGAGTRATLHGEEAVMTRPQVDRLVSMAVSGVPGSTWQAPNDAQGSFSINIEGAQVAKVMYRMSRDGRLKLDQKSVVRR